MSTGVDSFTNPENIEAIYPFAGFEVLYAILGILLWLAWHVRQTMIENREYERAMELYERVGIFRTLQQGGTEWLPDEQELSRAGPETETPEARSLQGAGAATQGEHARHAASPDTEDPNGTTR